VAVGSGTFAQIGPTGLINPSPGVLAMMQNKSWPIYVTDPYTIVFRMLSPYLYMPGLFLGAPGLMWDAQYMLNNHGGFGTSGGFPGNSYWGQHPVPGTGPYVFTNVSEMAYVKFTQNPLYWGNNLTAAQIAQNPILDPGHVKNVIINDKPDDFARFSDLSSGNAQIGVVQGTNWNLIQAVPSKYGYVTLPPWNGAVFALAMNTHKYPTNITDVRQAIAHAINYTAIYDTAFHGKMNPMVGPETPGWKQFYNLNNYSGYQYNVTLAQNYLKMAGVDVTKFPALDFTQPSGCSYCNIADQLIQSNLAAIGISVNIDIQSYNLYQAAYSQVNATLKNQMVGHLSLLGGENFAPSGVLTPSDPWVTFVSAFGGGDWALYNNQNVTTEVNSFFTSNNLTYIQSQLKLAQAQVYNDAPYAWIGTLGLWVGDGSLAWDKQVVSGFFPDPSWSGADTAPLINTVTFVNGQ
ncbi:MAG: ABC transporter substrate-binding protein, partial [Thaumarchaeota archaeon]|nr:ABC transporter substrate-binding protein [Nitrososphaerota archaeon]